MYETEDFLPCQSPGTLFPESDGYESGESFLFFFSSLSKFRLAENICEISFFGPSDSEKFGCILLIFVELFLPEKVIAFLCLCFVIFYKDEEPQDRTAGIGPL